MSEGVLDHLQVAAADRRAAAAAADGVRLTAAAGADSTGFTEDAAAVCRPHANNCESS